jgi:hypothetical protein
VNFQHAKITACKEDHNGVLQPGWTMTLDDGQASISLETGSNGCVDFVVTLPGDYTLAEELKDLWVQLVPGGGAYDIAVTSGFEATYTFVNAFINIDIDKQISDNYDPTTGTGDWADYLSEVIVGTPLYYRFLVKNTGGVALSDVTVTDPTLAAVLGTGDVLCSYTELAAGETQICGPFGPVPAEFTGMGSDYPNGRFENTARVDGCSDTFCVDDEDTAWYVGLYWAFTPGFWKNHGPNAPSGHDAWELTGVDYGTTLVIHVFPAAGDYVRTGLPLAGALKLRGGSGAEGAAETLLRAATAAYLNARFHEVQHGGTTQPNGLVYYPLSSAEVVAAVENALLSGDRSTMLDLAGQLDGYNNGIDDIVWPPKD